MNEMTNTEKERNIRTAFVALDAIQLLVDRGLGGLNTESCFSHIRELIRNIENAPIKNRRR